MINNENCSLEEMKQIINNQKIKSNSLKNYFLRNLNQNDISSQILSYLGELEYDLEVLNDLLSNFQIHYCNLIQNLKDSTLKQNMLNNDIKGLEDSLNKANNQIINLQKENNILKKGENGNTITFGGKKDNNYNDDDNNNNSGGNNKVCNSYRNYLNYNSCRTSQNNKNNNLYEIDNGCNYKQYGRLTYTRENNGNNKVTLTNNIYNNLINKNNDNNSINNKNINNNYINKKKINKSNKNKDNENYKNINRYITYTPDNNNKTTTNISNGLINYDKNNNSINIHDIINRNIRDKLNNNTNYNKGIDTINYFDSDNNLSMNNNKEKNLTEIRCPLPRNSYSSFYLPKSQNAIMNSKRLIPKYPYKIQSFNKRIADIPRVKDDKKNRINNILSIISSDDNKYEMLKSIFGNNIQAQLFNGDINDEYLEKIENVLFYMGDNKSIIPMSKRFQIQKRAKSNSAKKPNITLNNKKNRSLRQKLRDKKININYSNRKKWNTSRDFYINK